MKLHGIKQLDGYGKTLRKKAINEGKIEKSDSKDFSYIDDDNANNKFNNLINEKLVKDSTTVSIITSCINKIHKEDKNDN